MADIYLIYGREDEDRAHKLVGLLEKSWNVWWDGRVQQRFVDDMERELPQATCVVVLWSATSRTKDTVIDEVNLAKQHGVPIVAAKLDSSGPAYGFGGYTCTNLMQWKDDPTDRHFVELCDRVGKIVAPRRAPARPTMIAQGRLSLPTFFLSVSSFETQLVPRDAVKALAIARAPAILVSAWDLVSRRKPAVLINELVAYRDGGGFILIDSGNYEASRLGAKRWIHDDLREALVAAPHHWAFSFDKITPKGSVTDAAKQIIAGVKRDQALTSAPMLPIVHAPKLANGRHNIDILPELIRCVSEALKPELIAIPERELGRGMIQRALTMQLIRRALEKLPYYQPVHLLGTGNPWSIIILAAAGADTFDGLEWCRVAVDMQSDRLHHFQHFDFFSWQTEAGNSIARVALRDENVEFAGKVAFHNIDYFTRLEVDLRDAIARNRLEAFLAPRIGKVETEQLYREVPGLFQ